MSKKKEKNTELLINHEYIEYKQLTDSQKHADDTFKNWYFKKHKNPILRIGGCAGSGKTFFVQYLIHAYDLDLSNSMVMAYTGQAVNVLRQHGILAKTIHSSIMVPMEEPLMKNGKIIEKHGIPITVTKFRPMKSIPTSVKLIIVDESSFLPEKLEETLLRYNIPILEIGDPMQLPPVVGKQCFNMENLDYFIEGVMRQSEDSGILKLATLIRKRKKIDYYDYDCSDVIFLQAEPTVEETFIKYKSFMKCADMIITSTNKQRQIINDMYRDKIVKTDNPYPRLNERLICRKNEWNLTIDQYPLTNGTQGTCVSVVGRSMIDKTTHSFYMDFKPDFIDNDYYDNILCDSDFLMEPVGSNKEVNKYNPGKKFEYAYAISCQLAQGNQYDTVLFMDSFNYDRDYQMRVRYTAATRARRHLIYVVPYCKKYPGWFDLVK